LFPVRTRSRASKSIAMFSSFVCLTIRHHGITVKQKFPELVGRPLKTDLRGAHQYPLNENEVSPLPRTRNEIQHLSCRLPGHQPNKEEKIGGQETRTRATLHQDWIPAPEGCAAGPWAIVTGTRTRQTGQGNEDQ